MTNTDELLIDVLRAAGYEDAADLVSKLVKRIEPDEGLKVGAPTSTTPTHGNARAQQGVAAGVGASAGARRAG